MAPPGLRDHYVTMASYNAWMNRKVYDAAAALDDADRRRDVGAFFRSLHGTLNHLLLTDRAWLARFTGDAGLLRSLDGSMPHFSGRLDQELYDDFATLRREREKTDTDVERWAAGLTESTLAGPIAYYSVAYARDFEHPLWWAASHFFNHQTHHRGQATTLLVQLGHDPGITDLIDLLRTESA
jgi:uncharacterized damage-inducible protein DinB